jgi:hypothetical protein
LGEQPDPVSDVDLPDAPGLEDILDLSGIDYQETDDSLEAIVSFDHTDHRVELPGPVTLIWSDGLETEGTVMISGVDLEVFGERDDEQRDAEVTAVRFEQAVWIIGEDDDARFTEDSIETVWGDFPVISIRDNVIQYQPVGQRTIDSFTLEHEDGVIDIRGSNTSYDETFQPQQSNLRASSSIEELVDQLPLRSRVAVQGSGSGIVVPVGPEISQ